MFDPPDALFMLVLFLVGSCPYLPSLMFPISFPWSILFWRTWVIAAKLARYRGMHSLSAQCRGG